MYIFWEINTFKIWIMSTKIIVLHWSNPIFIFITKIIARTAAFSTTQFGQLPYSFTQHSDLQYRTKPRERRGRTLDMLWLNRWIMGMYRIHRKDMNGYELLWGVNVDLGTNMGDCCHNTKTLVSDDISFSYAAPQDFCVKEHNSYIIWIWLCSSHPM